MAHKRMLVERSILTFIANKLKALKLGVFEAANITFIEIIVIQRVHVKFK